MYTATLTAVFISIIINLILLSTHVVFKDSRDAGNSFSRLITWNLIILLGHIFMYTIMQLDLEEKYPFLNGSAIFFSFTSPTFFCYSLIKYIIALTNNKDTYLMKFSRRIFIMLLILGTIILADSFIIAAVFQKKNIYEMRYIFGFVYYISQISMLFVVLAIVIRSRRFINKKFFFALLALTILIIFGFLSLLVIRNNFASTATTLSILLIYIFIQRDRISLEQSNIEAIASIYHSMFVFDLMNESFIQKTTSRTIKKIFEDHENFSTQEKMNNVMNDTICDSHLENAIEFIDLSTLPERMKDKQSISLEVMNRDLMWCRFMFIRSNPISEEVTKVLFTIQYIDEEKRREENLIRISNTDLLTGSFNRNAFIMHTKDLKIMDNNFWYMNIDVNGLKFANDNFGHQAGDELIVGTSKCLSNAIGSCGNIYRIGGDEFAVLLHTSNEKFEKILSDINRNMNSWKGKYSSELYFSIGFVCASEVSEPVFSILAKIADQRMYENKKKFYEKNKKFEQRKK